MGFSLGNPIKSITNAVSNVVSTVSNTAQSVVNNVERSDIGNVVKVAVQPISTTNEMAKDIFKGKFESAGNRALGTVGSFASLPTQAIRMSSTLDGMASRDKFLNSWSKSADAFDKLKSGQSLTAEESSAVVNMYGKQAAIAGAVYGGATYGSTALSWMGKNAALTSLVGTQIIAGSKSGNYSDAISTIGNSISPGLGDIGNGLLTPRQPSVGVGSGSYDVSSNSPTGSTSFSLNNNTLIMAAIAAGLVLILAIFKKMRS